MKKNLKNWIEQNLDYLIKKKSSITIDADTHVSDLKSLKNKTRERYNQTKNYYQGRPMSAEELLQEMKMSGIDVSLTWQNPAATNYSEDPCYNYSSLYNANKYIFDSASAYPMKFIPAGWTDPKALGMDKALELVEICVKEFGFPIIKLNPAQNGYPVDSHFVITVFKKVIDLGAVPALHYGADTPFTPPEGLARLATHFHNSPLIAVHMGGGGAGYIEADDQYIKSRELGLKHPNIKYVLSAKRDTHIESDLITYQLAGLPFSSNLCCASDAPYGKQSWNFGGFRAMLKTLQDTENHPDKRIQENPGLFDCISIQNFLGTNFANLAIKGYEGILKHL